VETKGAFWKACAAVLIFYTIGISSLADFLAHQCGSYWFNYTFLESQRSLWIFAALGVVVFLICLVWHVGKAVQWWFWLAFAVMVLVGNSVYAASAPPSQTGIGGAEIRCVVRR
jgi:hypothetical protein